MKRMIEWNASTMMQMFTTILPKYSARTLHIYKLKFIWISKNTKISRKRGKNWICIRTFYIFLNCSIVLLIKWSQLLKTYASAEKLCHKLKTIIIILNRIVNCWTVFKDCLIYSWSVRFITFLIYRKCWKQFMIVRRRLQNGAAIYWPT